jgi:hypothetical protein
LRCTLFLRVKSCPTWGRLLIAKANQRIGTCGTLAPWVSL